MGCTKSSSRSEVDTHTSLPHEIRKISNKPSTLYLKELEKEQPKLKVSRRKGIVIVRGEINKIESKK